MTSPHNAGIEPKAKWFRDLFRSSKSQEREASINNAFAVSSIGSRGLSASLSSSSREHPILMTFNEIWRHPSCPVMQWYDKQKPNTRFSSIEHRRSIEEPFYHEFLLLKLADGAVCRVERLGEGLPMNAVRLAGIKSKDVIQWYPEEKYSKASPRSKIIAEINLGQEFDILDVLAICYAVRNTKPCSVYTLQRYNCYFLCLTILAILARRAASWETALTPGAWNSGVERVLDSVSGLSREKVAQYSILRLCAFLDPDNSQPGDLVVNTLRSHLITAPSCLDSYRRAASEALWHSSLAQPLSDNLRGEFDSVIKTVAGDTSQCGSHIRDIIAMSRDDAATRILENKQLMRCFATVSQKSMVSNADRVVRRCYMRQRMRWAENPAPFYAKPTSVLYSIILSTMVKYGVQLFIDKLDPRVKLDAYIALNMPYSTIQKLVQLMTLLTICYGEDASNQVDNEMRSDEVRIAVSIEIMNIISLHAEINQSDLKALYAFGFEGDSIPLPLLLAPLVVPGLVDLGCEVGEQQQRVTVQLSSQVDVPGIENLELTPTEFQNLYIKHRIDAHAKRVEDNHIAPAPLVSEDIEKAMEMVWRNLPKSFGGTFSDDAESGPSAQSEADL